MVYKLLISGNRKDFTVVAVDVDTGEMRLEDDYAAPADVSWIVKTSSRDGTDRFVGVSQTPECGLYTFEINYASKTMRITSKVPTLDGPSHFITLKDKSALALATYGGGSVALYPITISDEDGLLLADKPKVELIPEYPYREAGHGPDPLRQRQCHVHQVLEDRQGLLYAPDLGSDRVWIVRRNKAGLEVAGWLQCPPGHGSRHGVFSPDGKLYYVLGELSHTVVAFDLSTSPADNIQPIAGFSANIAPPSVAPHHRYRLDSAAIVPHPTIAGVLYCSNRWELRIGQLEPQLTDLPAEKQPGDAIALVLLSEDGREVQKVQHVRTHLDVIRGLHVSPDGKYAVACGQKGGGLEVYSISGQREHLENAASSEEARLPLPGPPITAEKDVIRNLISPKLRKSVSVNTIRRISGHSVLGNNSREDEQLLKTRVAQLADAFLRVKEDQRQAEADFERVTHTIATLEASCKEGECELGADEYGKGRRRMLSVQLQLLTTVSVLRTAGGQLAGRWADDLAIGARETIDNWAYIDAAIRCYPEPANANNVKVKRTPQKENKFGGDLIRAYTSQHPDKNEGTLWCPVAHMFLPSEHVTAAHVINGNIGERTTQALFGDDTEYIWSANNGLIITKAYEELLDAGKAVILPASNCLDEGRFIFYLLTKDLGRRKATVWGEELHGRTLSFQNEFRPSRRYLYFKSVVSILRRRRAEVTGLELDLPSLPSPAKTLWTLPGPYLKNSILYKFSRQLGCMPVEEANRFWDVKSPPTTPDVVAEDLTTTLEALSCSAVGTGDAERLSKENDSDDSVSLGDSDEENDGEYNDDEE